MGLAMTDDYQFNGADWRSLPPVDCPLMIRVAGEEVRATRTSHIERPDGEMEYLADDGRTFTGRYDWTYP